MIVQDWIKNLKKKTITILRGVTGIVIEVGYTLSVMLVAFLLCVLATSF